MNSYQSIYIYILIFLKLYFQPPYIPLLHYTRYFQYQAFVMILQLNSTPKFVSIICVFYLYKYEPNPSQRNLNILWHTRMLCLNIFFMKEFNNNLSVDLTFLFNVYILRSFIFILSKQMLKFKALSHSPLSANTCISNTCCTIMCIHQYI